MGFVYGGNHQLETKVMECVIGILEGRNKTEKVEVHLTQEGSTEGRIHIRLFSWGEGIGWYPQKTIVLDCREINALQTTLNRVKALIKTRKRQKQRAQGKLIPFPPRRKGIQTVERKAINEA